MWRRIIGSNNSNNSQFNNINNKIQTYSCETTLTGHSSSVYSVLQLQDGRLVSASGDYTLKIWNLKSCSCEMTLKGHTSDVFRVIELNDGVRLASASDDATIKIWNMNKGYVCENTLRGHTDRVFSVIQLKDGRLVSCSHQLIKIWDSSDFSCTNTLKGHNSWIHRVIQVQCGALVSCCPYDKSLKIWDVNSGECKHTFQCQGQSFSVLELQSGWIVSGESASKYVGQKNTINIWY